MTHETAGRVVLVVDDDPDMRTILASTLAGAGLTPVLAESGGRALSMLEEVAPDLILLDAMMPPPDGFATCRRIKQRLDFAAIPVMFMTGLTEIEHVLEGLRAGGIDYVTKPLNLDELVARVRAHLATSRMTRSAQRALDTAGRRLIATDEDGHIRWSTPQAERLFSECGLRPDDPMFVAELRRLMSQEIVTPVQLSIGERRIELAAIGLVDADYFFRVSEIEDGRDAKLLRAALQVTPREAEVLLWVAAGKASRDISEILNISARTVNKHLEQIYVKLGVENRATAAAIVTRIIASKA